MASTLITGQSRALSTKRCTKCQYTFEATTYCRAFYLVLSSKVFFGLVDIATKRFAIFSEHRYFDFNARANAILCNKSKRLTLSVPNISLHSSFLCTLISDNEILTFERVPTFASTSSSLFLQIKKKKPLGVPYILSTSGTVTYSYGLVIPSHSSRWTFSRRKYSAALPHG